MINNKEKNQIIFTSQKGQGYLEDKGCGVASLLMLFKHINFTPLPAWRELCDELKLTISPIENIYSQGEADVGLYPEDLFRYIVRQNLLFRMHFFEDQWQESLKKAPIMVLLDGVLEGLEDEGHWVVLTYYDNESFSYLDPLCKNEEDGLKIISYNRFKKHYTGIACQLFQKREIYELQN